MCKNHLQHRGLTESGFLHTFIAELAWSQESCAAVTDLCSESSVLLPQSTSGTRHKIGYPIVPACHISWQDFLLQVFSCGCSCPCVSVSVSAHTASSVGDRAAAAGSAPPGSGCAPGAARSAQRHGPGRSGPTAESFTELHKVLPARLLGERLIPPGARPARGNSASPLPLQRAVPAPPSV